jgi:uncharacterized protein YqgC (DUF456 family)
MLQCAAMAARRPVPGTPFGRAVFAAVMGVVGLAVPLLPSILAIALGAATLVEAGRGAERRLRLIAVAAILLGIAGGGIWGWSYSR